MKRNQMQNGYFKILKNAAGYLHVTLHAANHEILSTSETLSHRDAAFTNIAAQIKASGGKGALVINMQNPAAPVVFHLDAKGDIYETDAIVVAIPAELPGVGTDK